MVKASMYMTTGGGILGPGIHKNVTFNGVAVEEGKWFDILFQHEGASIRKRVFAPTGKLQIDGKSPAEVIEEEKNRNYPVMAQVLSAILPQAEFEKFGAKDYEAFVKAFAATGAARKGALVNLKVGVDKTGKYSEIPKYGVWVENAAVTESGLRFSAKENKAIEDYKGKTNEEETPVGGLFGGQSGSDLPF